jgi:hypothetical protein
MNLPTSPDTKAMDADRSLIVRIRDAYPWLPESRTNAQIIICGALVNVRGASGLPIPQAGVPALVETSETSDYPSYIPTTTMETHKIEIPDTGISINIHFPVGNPPVALREGWFERVLPLLGLMKDSQFFDGTDVLFDELPDKSLGRYSPVGGEIVVGDTSSFSTFCRIIFHELGHKYMADAHNSFFSDKPMDREAREFVGKLQILFANMFSEHAQVSADKSKRIPNGQKATLPSLWSGTNLFEFYAEIVAHSLKDLTVLKGITSSLEAEVGMSELQRKQIKQITSDLWLVSQPESVKRRIFDLVGIDAKVGLEMIKKASSLGGASSTISIGEESPKLAKTLCWIKNGFVKKRDARSMSS